MGTARPTGRELITEIRSVLGDLPVILTAPLYRRWHLHWGATPAEVSSQLPGDGLIPNAQYASTRAITIDAPPDAVWPWLVQVGCLRAGWYSNDLLDNLGRPSASAILPALQHLEVGQWVPMAPTPSERSALKVGSFEVNRSLLWTTPDSTWAWQLIPIDGNETRLIARIIARYDWRHPLFALLGVILMEFGDFPMLRRMLRGIKTRAESAEHSVTPTSVAWRPSGRTATGTGILALAFSALYFLSDVIEVGQGGFSVGQLWLTLAAEAAIPVFVAGLAIMYRQQLGRLGQVSAWSYAYAYVVFTGTVVYALVNHTKDYQTLTDHLGAVMIAHGAIMVLAGLGFGYAVLRMRLLPAWTGLALMVGVVLVAITQGLPDGPQLAAAGVRDLAFAGMGAALLRNHRAPTASQARSGALHHA